MSDLTCADRPDLRRFDRYHRRRFSVQRGELDLVSQAILIDMHHRADVYKDGLDYEVEFTTLDGKTAAVTVETAQVRPVGTREMAPRPQAGASLMPCWGFGQRAKGSMVEPLNSGVVPGNCGAKGGNRKGRGWWLKKWSAWGWKEKELAARRQK